MTELSDLSRSLGEHPLCQGLREEDVAFLAGCAKNQRTASGAFLAREGDSASSLFLIRSGSVALEVQRPGRVSRVETVGAGDVLGWNVLFPPHAWHLDLRALDSVLAFAVDGACLRGKLASDHSFGFRIAMRLLERVHNRLERARLAQLDVLGR